MGGFTVNGIGATDHFKKVKSLGVRKCPKCGKETEFFLEIAKFKVDIFFIPTVTLKTRYAVMCSSCENGMFVSDAWAAQLLNEGEHPVIFEGLAPQNDKTAERTTVNTQATPEPKLPDATSLNGTAASNTGANTAASAGHFSGTVSAPSYFKCPKCGVTQMRDGNFCAYCGTPAPAPDNGDAGKVNGGGFCPSCGSKVKPGAAFCDQCGTKL